MSSIFGWPIHISYDKNKYTLPEEVIPGVTWPAGFRDEINNWSRDFIGTWNLVKDSEVMQVGSGYNRYFLMTPRTYDALKNKIDKEFPLHP